MARRKRGRDLHGILLFDKPAGGSSNQVLQRVRRMYDANKAGHTGSLDPLATGMLPVCFGEATKLSGFLLDAEKGYETTLQLGVTTDSADADGDIVERRPIPSNLSASEFGDVCATLVGDQMQVPPMVSAIKVNGQRLYKLAREGKTIEREPRAVCISRIDVLAFSGDTAQLSVVCSKGTYIRSLVTDIGEKLGCGAHVTALRRTFVSPFTDSRMWSESELAQHGDPDALLLPVDAGLDHLPAFHLARAATGAFGQGQAVARAQAGTAPAADSALDRSAGDICRVYDSEGGLLGLGSLAEPGKIAPKRVLQMCSGDTIAG